MQECSQALKMCKCLWGLFCGGVFNMLLILSITFHCHFIYGIVWVQLTHFSLDYWNDISRAHVIIIIKSKGSTLPIVFIFSVVVCLRCLLHDTLSLIANTFRENRDFVFAIIVQIMMSANSPIRFGLLIVFVCLYITPSQYHHCANLSEDIELLKCLSDIICRVCKIKHIFSVMNSTIYGAVCFQFNHFPCDDWENIYFVLLSSSNRKYGLLSICLGLGHETMVCALCLSIFLWAWHVAGQYVSWPAHRLINVLMISTFTLITIWETRHIAEYCIREFAGNVSNHHHYMWIITMWMKKSLM